MSKTTHRKAVALMQWAVMVARQERKPMAEALRECAAYGHESQRVFTAAAVMLGLAQCKCGCCPACAGTIQSISHTPSH